MRNREYKGFPTRQNAPGASGKPGEISAPAESAAECEGTLGGATGAGRGERWTLRPADLKVSRAAVFGIFFRRGEAGSLPSTGRTAAGTSTPALC
jgi:hypothetical protein